MSCAKVLGIGFGVMVGGIMTIQTIGEMRGAEATNASPKVVAQPAPPPKAENPDAAAPREEKGDGEASPPKVDAPSTDKETSDMLAISIILNGYGCHKVKHWSGDGLSGKNIVTCVERKGRSKVVRYAVDPLEGNAVML